MRIGWLIAAVAILLWLVVRVEATAPNIVLIIADDQGWGDYGFMGHDKIQTPHLDNLAAESALFRRGYVPTALCRPSLATLLTGHYASVHGITGNDPSPKGVDRDSDMYRQQRSRLIAVLDNLDTLPKLLGARGYLSHQSGKLWEGSYKNCGFTHGMTRGFPNPGGRHGDAGLSIGRDGLAPIADFLDHTQQQRKPFFLWYAPFMPHTPHNPPDRLLGKYRSDGTPPAVAKYYAMCEWLDETCGELLHMLDERNLTSNTLVVYLADNGWIQNPRKSRYAPRSKQTAYEGGIRTPIMFRWPGKIQAADRSELVSSIDVVPTLLAAAGSQVPRELPGQNLIQELQSGSPIRRQRIFGEGFAHDIADLDDPEASLLYRWCIEGKWKLLLTYDGETHRYAGTHPRAEKRPQLFDLATDPTEQHNLAGENPKIVARLAAEIGNWYPLKKRKTLVRFDQTAITE